AAWEAVGGVAHPDALYSSWSCLARGHAASLHIGLPSTSWPDEDPAIQFCFRAARRNLDHRVSTLCVGPVMTEKTSAAEDDECGCVVFPTADPSASGSAARRRGAWGSRAGCRASPRRVPGPP